MDAPQEMQFLGTIKKLASLFPRLQNAKWRGKAIIFLKSHLYTKKK